MTDNNPRLTAREVDQLLGVNGNHIPNNGYVTREDRRRVAEAYREMENAVLWNEVKPLEREKTDDDHEARQPV